MSELERAASIRDKEELMLGTSKMNISCPFEQTGPGGRSATDAFFSLVYDELRRLAKHYARAERPDHTLPATALVHEAYVRLAGNGKVPWENRAHFLGAAARAMRFILVEHSRRHQRVKRGRGYRRATLDDTLVTVSNRDLDVLALEEALARLGKIDPQKARVVELRFYGGLTVQETAEALGVGVRTVAREWRFAKTWLQREIGPGDSNRA